MAREKSVVLVVTQGTSPGVAAEAYHNIVTGRAVDYDNGVLRGRVESVVIVATSGSMAVLAARAAAAILTCCMGLDPNRVRLVFAPCSDVTDAASYGAYYDAVYETLESVLEESKDSIVVLDVTGGRVGMAIAAFEAVNAMLTRDRVRVTTTQVPPEKYRAVQEAFNEMKGRLEEALARFEERVKTGDAKRACEELLEETRSDKNSLCSLVTREAITAAIWPRPPAPPRRRKRGGTHPQRDQSR
ncbi:hypothetical protein Pyrfu_0517 [Pyrolobus fumarii 1A]|uniref:CRISPR-associated protein n=1 Tax=Pyrolobus fumarii (strain DSM 11204 / 1A) TaxID=694429 RepID=G0EGL4_PYRF1|nr:hypothetical protein [Pyrolobus fumarii]AEM38388.1 hypothetical protein Pyrfu_0517 [Pyrolobus fumarii 1A]